jgi:3-oxoacyl-[acyl-carrier protein] reductase
MSSLDGKVALVTGASRGIGRGIATRLAADGATVAVHYAFNESAANETVSRIRAAGGRAFTIGAELGIDGDAEKLFAAFDAAVTEHTGAPALDILVNNAGRNGPGPIESATADGFDRVFALNVKAPFLITKLALDRLRDGGRIINISSGASAISWETDPAYGMTKAALDSLTRSLARQLGSRNITVNTVAPGVIDTDMNASWLRDNPEGQAAGAAWSVFRRVGQPEDVADAVAFVASTDGRWVTGQFLDATGGSLLIGP